MKKISASNLLSFMLGVLFILSFWIGGLRLGPDAIERNTRIEYQNQNQDLPSDVGESWISDLSERNGKWRSLDPECEMTIHDRVISFGGKNFWSDLNQKEFLVGPNKDFITEKYYYMVSFLGDDIDTIAIMRSTRQSHGTDPDAGAKLVKVRGR